MMLRSLLIISLFLSNFCFSNQKERLQAEDTAILNIFFHTLFDREGGGYVFFDQKPVCWSGFEAFDHMMPETLLHKDSVALKEGMRVWRRLTLNSKLKNKNICLQCYDTHNSDGAVDLLLINKPLCLKSIRDNLSLFQYILGPKVTPESLLDALLSAKNFNSILKNDRVLIGILLGFGSANAIMAGRSENIKETLLSSPDIPPFESMLMQAPQLTQNEKIFLFFSPSAPLLKHSDLQPSFGFSTLEKEFYALEDSMDVSPDSLQQRPAFIFGYVKNDPPTQELIKKLKEVQPKVRVWMNSPTFLAEVLKMLSGKDAEIGVPKQIELKLNDSLIPQMNFIIAKNIWNQIKSSDEDYINEFLIGFQAPDSQADIRSGFFPDHYKDRLQEARKNIIESCCVFETLDKNSDFTSIVPKQLYYKVLKKGEGKQMNHPRVVKLNYQITNPDDACLVTEWEKIIDPSQTIPGFAHGIKGMAKGETREIYIAPSLAYGVHTLLDKGIYLKARVTLLDILSDKLAKNYPDLIPVDLTFVFDPTFERKISEENKQVARFEGARVAKHYAKSKIINIKEVYSTIVNLKNNKYSLNMSDEELEMINKFHWNIYYGR